MRARHANRIPIGQPGRLATDFKGRGGPLSGPSALFMRISASIAILRTQPDERLVRLARNGSEPAFSALVERHRRMVLSRCRCVLPEARAEDAAQVTFLSAWKALRRGDEV